jgi:two-component system, sensor histidine kinase RegB
LRDDSPFRVNFGWLTRLRFGAAVGQLVVILGVTFALDMKLPLAALGVVLGCELALNLWALSVLRRKVAVTERHVTLAVGADLLLFSALLYFSGGPANPFNFLYLVHIALAAIVLPTRTSFALVLSALACSLLLFWVHVPLPHDHAHHQQHYDWHMRGMWVAFGLAAGFIVYFIQRVLRELRSIEQQLADSRERATRGEAVAALAMLSAGAAHELASPLSTIALASGELLRRLTPDAAGEAARQDVLLIRDQVERCRNILDQLAVEAGQAKGSGLVRLSADKVFERSLEGLDRAQVRVEPGADAVSVIGSLSAVSQALRNLVKNALDASPNGRPVQLGVTERAGEVIFTVTDEGVGMTPDVLARALEPFFTTKPRGKGMGLGLFLAQSVAEQMGGRLELSSAPGEGTRASLVLRTAATNSRMVTTAPGSQAAPTHG